MSSSGDKFKMNDGDWVCSDSQCGNVNFARRSSCNRCGKDKSAIPPRKKLGHEIGKAAAEKSRGLFSADDWQCGRCGNVNWARRQTCNMCNAPKFGEVEERTGLGGGYNERENVEYIQREDSDGEYDEFGRKKKKYRGDEKPAKVMKTPAPVVENKHKIEDEEEEEEEDDDEDGDLSKYDLTGWGDDDDEDKDTANKKDKKSTSPAHSHSSASSKSSRSRSSSSSSSSSQSSHASLDSGKAKSKNKRHYSRSRSNSPVNKKKSKNASPGSSRSSSKSSNSRDRSISHSPTSQK